MLEWLSLKNFTAFPEARLEFSKHLNVIVGENGVGKTHLLKLPYAAMAMSAEEGKTAQRTTHQDRATDATRREARQRAPPGESRSPRTPSAGVAVVAK